tara:strand:+ start:1045 stop:1320 length:276 start_codon:yes stop_codon:yes gene_type:complete
MLNLHLLLRTKPFRITLWIIPGKKHFDAMAKRGAAERLSHVLRPIQSLSGHRYAIPWRARHGRKAQARTQTDAFEGGCPANATSGNAQITI